MVSDVRLRVLAHDLPVLGEQRERGADFNGEILFVPPIPNSPVTGFDPGYRWLFRPSLDIGIDANTSGYSSQIYLGLTWTVELNVGSTLWPDHTVFLGIGFGPAFNNGHIHSSSDYRLSIGSNMLFHPSQKPPSG